MLTEKYVDIKVELADANDEYADPEVYYEEVYVNDNEIKHYIDTYLSAEDVLNYAKQIDANAFDNDGDLDLAYEILIDEFDEHDDIEDIRDLHEYISDLIQNDYEKEATENVIDDIQTIQSDDEQRHWGL